VELLVVDVLLLDPHPVSNVATIAAASKTDNALFFILNLPKVMKQIYVTN
jgi:hypothetical protein